MSPATHCLPNGFLGTAELPVCAVAGSSITVFNPPAGVGHRRGIVIYLHGLYTQQQQVPAPPGIVASGVTGASGGAADTYNALGSVMANTLCTNLATDGWVVIAIPAQEDGFTGVPSAGVYLDVQNDTGLGARYLASTLHVWDHAYRYVQMTYGNWPVVVGGFSLGGWRTMQIVLNRTDRLAGYFAHQPATYLENAGPGYTPGSNFGLLNWSGLDLSATALNAIPLPGLIGYGTIDTAVFYGGASTVQTTTTSTNVTAVTAFTVSGGSTNFNAGPGQVTLTGLSGGSGQATFLYTSYSAGSFTTLTLQAGSGTIVTGTTLAVQSTTDSMLTNALGASQPVTRNSTAEPHSLSITDTGAYYAGTATTISAINTATTLQITPTQASCQGTAAQALISTKCSIQDTGGAWHTITFSGVSTPNLTGVSIAGSGSIAANAPIMNTGTAITGGFSNQSIPYWVNQVLDPSYPATL